MPPRKRPTSPPQSPSTTTTPSSPHAPAPPTAPPRNPKVSTDKVTKPSKAKPATTTAPKPTAPKAAASAPDKKEKLTDAQAAETVLAYLDAQNRPYSAGDVSSNLHNAVSRVRVDKILREASELGRCVGKAAGKQWVFHRVQDPDDTCSKGDLEVLDGRIKDARERVAQLKAGLKGRNVELARVRGELGTVEVRERVQMLEARKIELGKRLDILRSGGVKLVSREERDDVEVEHARWSREKGIWMKGFKELEEVFLEGMGREELWEKAGVEDDVVG